MGIVIGILVTLLVIAAAIIFFLVKVFFSTLEKLEEVLDFNDILLTEEDLEGLRNYEKGKAYDDKYYPCKMLLLNIKFEQKHPTIIADFSMYDSHQIAGLVIHTSETLETYAKNSKDWEEYRQNLEGQGEDEANLILPQVTMYSPIEGVWTWKFE